MLDHLFSIHLPSWIPSQLPAKPKLRLIPTFALAVVSSTGPNLPNRISTTSPHHLIHHLQTHRTSHHTLCTERKSQPWKIVKAGTESYESDNMQQSLTPTPWTIQTTPTPKPRLWRRSKLMKVCQLCYSRGWVDRYYLDADGELCRFARGWGCEYWSTSCLPPDRVAFQKTLKHDPGYRPRPLSHTFYSRFAVGAVSESTGTCRSFGGEL